MTQQLNECPRQLQASRETMPTSRTVLWILASAFFAVVGCYDGGEGPNPVRTELESRIATSEPLALSKEELCEILVGDWTAATLADGWLDEAEYTFKSDRTYSVQVTKCGEGAGGKIGLLAFGVVGLSSSSGSWIVVEEEGQLYLVIALGKLGTSWEARVATSIVEIPKDAGFKWRVARTGPNELACYKPDGTLDQKLTRKGPLIGK